MAVRATAKYLRVSPRKGRLLADLVRGMDVEEALNQLKFNQKQAAGLMAKVISSALANANQKPGTNVDKLYVREVFVDGGPTLKRFMTRAMGRASRINKRTCHMTVVLDERIS